MAFSLNASELIEQMNWADNSRNNRLTFERDGYKKRRRLTEPKLVKLHVTAFRETSESDQIAWLLYAVGHASVPIRTIKFKVINIYIGVKSAYA